MAAEANTAAQAWKSQTINSSALAGRAGAAACVLSQKTGLLHGGSSGEKSLSDVCLLDLETGDLKVQQCIGAAPTVSGHTAALAPASSGAVHPDGAGGHGAVVICGGMDQSLPSVHNDVWVLDVATWAWRSVDVACGAVPEPRTGHTAAIYGSGMWLVGGANPEAGPLGDVWVLWMHAQEWFWQPVLVSPPLPPRELHAMHMLPGTEHSDEQVVCLAVWGGRDRTGMVTSLQQLQLPAVSAAEPQADGVPALQGGTYATMGSIPVGFAASSQSCRVASPSLPGVCAAVFGGFDGAALTGTLRLLQLHSPQAASSIDAHAQDHTPSTGLDEASAVQLVADPTAELLAVQPSMQVHAAEVVGTEVQPSFAASALPHASQQDAFWVIGGLTGPQCSQAVHLLQLGTGAGT